MKLCEEVKSVLDVACPVWMKKLCAVNFDLAKLESFDDQHTLQSNFAWCFIGEIHDGKDTYSEYDFEGFCESCKIFAKRVPMVFTEFHDDEDKLAILKTIADHVKEKHPELMHKKPVENDC